MIYEEPSLPPLTCWSYGVVPKRTSSSRVYTKTSGQRTGLNNHWLLFSDFHRNGNFINMLLNLLLVSLKWNLI